MRWPAVDSFRVQVALIAVASLSVAALAVVLVRDAFSSTEEALTREALRQCAAAAGELRQQYLERARFQDEAAGALPLPAQDVSLRGLTAVVLRSYQDMAGGFALTPSGDLLGDSAPRQLTAEERAWIARLAATSAVPAAEPLAETIASGHDVLVAALLPVGPELPVAWALKRLSGVRDPVLERRRWGLAALVTLAVAGVAGVISISVRLRRAAGSIRVGLRTLEEDFSHRLPPVGGDFGVIASAINRMAERRASLEAQMRRQDRLAALGKMAAGVAHEIRNPLNSIRLSLELLERRARKGTATGEEVAGAMEEVDRLDRILTRLLAFSRPGFEDRRVQSVRPIVDRAVAMVRQPAQDRRVTIDVRAERVEADVDGDRLEQVLINLLLNAIEASPVGGRVELTAAPDPDGLRITVHDDGAGVAPGIREHIFDPYFTTKENGVGLGLALSREAVAQHGGALDLAPQNGRGSTFVLHLPLRRRTT
jgi:signal transduction histidine kinase